MSRIPVDEAIELTLAAAKLLMSEGEWDHFVAEPVYPREIWEAGLRVLHDLPTNGLSGVHECVHQLIRAARSVGVANLDVEFLMATDRVIHQHYARRRERI